MIRTEAGPMVPGNFAVQYFSLMDDKTDAYDHCGFPLFFRYIALLIEIVYTICMKENLIQSQEPAYIISTTM